MSNSVIDLSKLPAPEFVETLDYEFILAAMLDDLKTRHPNYSNVLESDPAYKILEVAAYRELLLRHRINEEGRALLVSMRPPTRDAVSGICDSFCTTSTNSVRGIESIGRWPI